MADSEYSGFVGKNKRAKAASAKEGFDVDYEGMKTAYESYKRPGDPSSKDMSRRLGLGSESAAKFLHRAEHESDRTEDRERATMGRKSAEMGKSWEETFGRPKR